MRMSSIAAALLCATTFASDGRAQAPAPAQPPAAPAQAAPAEAKPTTGKVGELIPAATAKVMRGGKEATLDTQKNGKTTVYYLVGLSCPATKPYIGRVQALEATYAAKGVEFVFVYVNKPEKAADKAKFHKDNKYQGVFWDDADSSFVKSLKAQKTGEALIVDKDGKVVYRGGIDDNLENPTLVKSKFVATALDEILAGKPVTTTKGVVYG